MSRRWLRHGVTALAALLVLHTALWFAALWLLDGQVATQREAAAAQGWDITAGPPRWGGWPLAARLEFGQFDVAARDGAVAWHSEQARFGLELLHPFLLVTDLAGAHRLRLGAIEVPVQASQLRIATRLQAPPLLTDLAARQVRAELPGGPVSVAAIDVHATQDPRAAAGQPALILAATATAIDLPPMRAAGSFGPRIDAAALDATVTGPLLQSLPPREAASAWRAGGGRLSLQRLTLKWSKLDVMATAQVALDDRLQPAGSGTLRAIGVPESLDALAAAGFMPQSTARAVKAVTALMARPPEGEVEIPFSLADRTLTVARFPIARLPELPW